MWFAAIVKDACYLTDLPLAIEVCQKMQRWLKAGCFEKIVYATMKLTNMVCVVCGEAA